MTHPSLPWATLGLLLLAGCAADTSRPKIQGQVTYNNQPLADRTLVLTSEAPDGDIQTIMIGPDGRFQGEVPRPGTYKVSIQESMAVMEGVGKARKDGMKIAPKYRSAAASDTKITIQRGLNDLVIELKD